MQDSEIDRRPIDPRTGQPLTRRAQPGYYPGYSTLSQQSFWDEATRNVVLARVNDVPPMRFFRDEQEELFKAVVARILPQDDRDADHQIPLAQLMDKSIFEDNIDGYQYEDMPPMQQAHRLGLQAIDAIAHHLYKRRFVALSMPQQDEVLDTLRNGKPPVPVDVWRQMSSTHYWTLLMQTAVEAYYSHPLAWDEIGFGGPAYPRPYFRLENGEPEPWEKDEQRYEWAPPPGSLSHAYTPMTEAHPHRSGSGTGASGTH